jgi:hypothetical protein
MSDVLRLIDAICEAYDAYHVPKDVDGKPGDETFCNMAVNYVCSRLGYEKFKGMVANQIVDYMRRKPEEWEPVNMDAAQALANEGRLLLAGVQDEPHGHVAVIRPGVEEYSGKWKAKAPKTGNVGGSSAIGKSLAWAFGGYTPPEIWMLKNAPDLAVVKA